MNPLTNALTPRIRGLLYAALFVAGVVFSAYQAADGDIMATIGGVITALLGALAASNITQPPEDPGPPPGSTSVEDAIETFHGGTGVSDATEGDPALGAVLREPPRAFYRGEHEA